MLFPVFNIALRTEKGKKEKEKNKTSSPKQLAIRVPSPLPLSPPLLPLFHTPFFLPPFFLPPFSSFSTLSPFLFSRPLPPQLPINTPRDPVRDRHDGDHGVDAAG